MEPYVGEIRLFAGDFAPRGWLLCDGTLLQIHRYQNLFSIISTYYGGDGMQTFAVPDLRGRAAVQPGQGQGLSQYYLGQQAGSETTTLRVEELPAHSHGVNALKAAATLIEPTDGLLAAGRKFDDQAELQNFGAGTPDTKLSNQTIEPTGGNRPISLMQPVLAINYIIAVEGIYPPRP